MKFYNERAHQVPSWMKDWLKEWINKSCQRSILVPRDWQARTVFTICSGLPNPDQQREKHKAALTPEVEGNPWGTQVTRLGASWFSLARLWLRTNKCTTLAEKELRPLRNEGLGHTTRLTTETSRGGSRGWGHIRMNSGGGKKWAPVVALRPRAATGTIVFPLNSLF